MNLCLAKWTLTFDDRAVVHHHFFDCFRDSPPVIQLTTQASAMVGALQGASCALVMREAYVSGPTPVNRESLVLGVVKSDEVIDAEELLPWVLVSCRRQTAVHASAATSSRSAVFRIFPVALRGKALTTRISLGCL